jgi:hypothetical protein
MDTSGPKIREGLESPTLREGSAPTFRTKAPPIVRAMGNVLVDGDGAVVHLRGVSRSGTQDRCAFGLGIFDGAADDASILAIRAWNANTIRVPLNEECWLGVDGAPFTGPAYRAAIEAYVDLARSHGMYVILSLEISTFDSNTLSHDEALMPNANHSPAFWSQVALAFRDDQGVLFRPIRAVQRSERPGRRTCCSSAESRAPTRCRSGWTKGQTIRR